MPVTPAAPRPARRAPHAGAARRRPGFTLVELLVAVTLGLVVLGVLGKLFMTQLRTFARTQGAVSVQRDLRLGIALLPLDLRGAARTDADLTSDFVSLSASAIELRATIGGSVVCDTVTIDKTALVLPPPGLATATLTSFYTTPQTGDVVKVLTRSQTQSGGNGDAWITAAVGTSANGVAGLQAFATPLAVTTGLCAGAGPTPALPRQLLPVVWNSAAVSSDQLKLVVPGMPIRVLRRVRYELYQASSGRWLLGYSERQADGTWSTREPIAGPFEAQSSTRGPGVSFAYFDTTGAPLAPPVAPDRVGRIDVSIRPRTQVRAGAGRDSVVARDSALVRVALRNRF